jgi:hypothetical protein
VPFLALRMCSDAVLKSTWSPARVHYFGRSEAMPVGSAHRGSRGGPASELDKFAARLAAEVHVAIAHSRTAFEPGRTLPATRPKNVGAISVDARHRATGLGKDLMGGTVPDRRSPGIVALAAAC